ncbi:SAR2788 family putative toxin [Rossellomorea marisflavi]|uniref:SAR2788 family putative toxin n=1 Tax=Rossellomorea marisflavi TaxID=189381 RepID=UPI00069F1136|nr:SAR2788 family putative toxin [Rossellomorea marisflavi]
MKKNLISIIILTVLLAYVPTGFVSAQESENNLTEPVYISNYQGDSVQTEEELIFNEEYDISSEDEVDTTLTKDGPVKKVESTLDTGEVYIESELNYNDNNGEMIASAILQDEYGNDIEKSFSIMLISANNEDINAIFIDQETGEEYSVNTEEMNASIAPLVGVLVLFIAKQGLKAAIKKWGPSVVRGMIKNQEKVARAAAKDLGYKETNYMSKKASVYVRGKGKGPKYITRDIDGHNGGTWKGAPTVKALGSKKTRSGTYDTMLKRIGD